MAIISNGKKTESINDSEFAKLADFLTMIRTNQPWVTEFVWQLLIHVERGELTPANVADALVQGVYQPLPSGHDYWGFVVANTELEAAYHEHIKRPFVELQRHDFQAVGNYLDARHADYWFADFAEMELLRLADGHRRTPGEVLAALLDQIEKFNADVETARRTMEHFPALFED